MLTLEQAIKHAEEVANDYEDMTHDYTLDSTKLHKCAKEHRQLATWLRELQERRKAPEIVRCGECARRRTMCDGKDRCTVFNVFVDSDGYCKWAERRTDG